MNKFNTLYAALVESLADELTFDETPLSASIKSSFDLAIEELGLDVKVQFVDRPGKPVAYIKFKKDDPTSLVFEYDGSELQKHLGRIGWTLRRLASHELGHWIAAQQGAAPDEEHLWLKANKPELAHHTDCRKRIGEET